MIPHHTCTIGRLGYCEHYSHGILRVGTSPADQLGARVEVADPGRLAQGVLTGYTESVDWSTGEIDYSYYPIAQKNGGHVTSAHNPSRAPARFDWAEGQPGAGPDEWGPLAVFCACWVACLAVLIGVAVWAAVVNWGNA